MSQIDQEFNYAGYHGIASKCRLRVWMGGRVDRMVFVMMTELDNSGTSVTNRSEHIATMVNKDILIPKFGIDRDRAIWIEHYSKGGVTPWDTFDVVTYDWDTKQQAKNPSWHRVSQRWVEELIREELG